MWGTWALAFICISPASAARVQSQSHTHQLCVAGEEDSTILPGIFHPETRNQRVDIYSSLGRWGISSAPQGIRNYPRIIFWPLLPPTPPSTFFFSKETSQSVCICFKASRLHSQHRTPLRNSKGPGKRQNHRFEGEFLRRWNLRGMWWSLLMWTLQNIKAFKLPLAGWCELPEAQREGEKCSLW